MTFHHVLARLCMGVFVSCYVHIIHTSVSAAAVVVCCFVLCLPPIYRQRRLCGRRSTTSAGRRATSWKASPTTWWRAVRKETRIPLAACNGGSSVERWGFVVICIHEHGTNAQSLVCGISYLVWCVIYHVHFSPLDFCCPCLRRSPRKRCLYFWDGGAR